MKTLIRLVLLSCVLTLLCNCLFLTTTTSAAWWGQERSQRQQAIQTYVDENHAAFASFKNAPLAIKQDPLNFVGVQMIMFRLFPVIFPDIWGNPQDQMAVLGFGPDPFEPESVMPLGTGYHLSQPFTVPDIQENVSVNYATLTCMGCHSGQVTKPDGEVIRLVGAPNLLGDFLGTVHRTVNDPRYTAENFRTVLNQEPPGWVYGTPIQSPQEEFERALFNAPGGAEYFLEELKFISNQRNQRIDETLLPYTYNRHYPK
jgi:hypothetical protein